jgi:2-keto-4-pentenoate hydratase
LQRITDLAASRAAQVLVDEHREDVRFRAYAGEFGVSNIQDAYAVQREYVRLQSEIRKVVSRGYKIGLTSARMQAMCRIDSPLAGVVLSDRVHFSGVRIARSDYGRLGLEFEIAVKMARDLSGGRHTVDEVSAAVEHVCPAIEIVDDRNADYSDLEALSLISDNSWNAGIVLGDFQGDWPDLAEIEGRATMDGAEIGRGQGRDVLDHPFHAVAWLADHLASSGSGLRAGDILMTGSIITTKFPDAPCRYRFELGELGAVEVSIE